MRNLGWHGVDETTDLNMFGIPHLGLNLWNPIIAGAARWNAQAHEGFGMLASEWQDFVSRRIQEDLAFTQRVAHCRTADQAWSEALDFWQKAVEDYGKEYMVIGRLVAGLTTKTCAAVQSAAEDASTEAFSRSRAA